MIATFFFSTILMLSSVTGQITYATVTEDPGTYMTGQRIASYEEMGIDSLLTKYENNSLDPKALINDIYERIELNNETDGNPQMDSEFIYDLNIRPVDTRWGFNIYPGI
jgi:hypothetical protein